MKTKSAATSLVRILRETGVIPADLDIFAQEQPRNHDRRGDLSRQQYVLYSGLEIIGFLTVGQDLSSLHDHARLFQSAYPAFGNQVLGFAEHRGTSYLLESHFKGQPAFRLLGQPDGSKKILAILQKIEATFNAALKPSTHQAAQAELNSFFSSVVALPYWTPVDRMFLQEIVLPHLQAHLMKHDRLQRRVTNGDFLMRNLLVDDAGQFRIIDCEFASDTHFHTEDWVRFGYWDALPEILQTFANRHVQNRGPWTIYLCLKQLLFESRVNLPRKAQADAIHWCEEIRRLLGTADAAAQQSFFWPAIGQSFDPIRFEAQLFWLTDDGWSHEASARTKVEVGRQQHLLFEIPADAIVHGLRFDPMNCAGLVTIHSLKVMIGTNENELLRFGAEPSILQQLNAAGDSFVDTDTTDAFRIISLGADPQLYLPNIGKLAGQTMRVEIVVSYATDPKAQIASLGRALRSLKEIADVNISRSERDRRIAAIARDVTETQAQVSIATASLESLAESNEQHFVSLAEKVSQQSEAERKLRETQNDLVNLQALLPERDRQISFARDALLGHARTIDRLELLRDRLQQDLDVANVQVKAQIAHLQASEDQKGRLAQELAAAREKLTALADNIRISNTINSTLGAEIHSFKNALESSLQRETQSAATIATLAQNLAGFETKLADIAGEHRQLGIDLATERNRRKKIEATRSWRWTSWLRQLGGEPPPSKE